MDTFIVTLLIKGGCSQKQASAFERWLEDECPVGVGPARLTECIRRAMMSDAVAYISAMRSLDDDNRRLMAAIKEYQQHSTMFAGF